MRYEAIATGLQPRQRTFLFRGVEFLTDGGEQRHVNAIPSWGDKWQKYRGRKMWCIFWEWWISSKVYYSKLDFSLDFKEQLGPLLVQTFLGVVDTGRQVFPWDGWSMNELCFEMICKHFQFLSETKTHLQKSEQRGFCYTQNKNERLK